MIKSMANMGNRVRKKCPNDDKQGDQLSQFWALQYVGYEINIISPVRNMKWKMFFIQQPALSKSRKLKEMFKEKAEDTEDFLMLNRFTSEHN